MIKRAINKRAEEKLAGLAQTLLGKPWLAPELGASGEMFSRAIGGGIGSILGAPLGAGLALLPFADPTGITALGTLAAALGSAAGTVGGAMLGSRGSGLMHTATTIAPNYIGEQLRKMVM